MADDTAANSGDTQTQQTETIITPSPAPSPAEAVTPSPAPSPSPVPSEDWRVKLAGGDEKELKRLARFASESDVYKAYRELEKKKSSGELVTKIGKDSTAEEIAQWRKEHGIPETADKYDLTFDSGLVIGENDKPVIDEFVAAMHGENATPSQVKTAIATYYDIIGKQQQAKAEQDVIFKDDSLEALRSEWQGDFKKNLNAVKGLLESMPDDVRSYFETARTEDGKVLGNDPSVVKWLAEKAFEINPADSVMPNSTGNPGASISDEIASIEKIVGDKQSEYWKGQTDASGNTKMQVRYAELLAAQEKIAARS